MDLFYCLLICVWGCMLVFSHCMVTIHLLCSDPQSELFKGRAWFYVFLSFQVLVWGLTPFEMGHKHFLNESAEASQEHFNPTLQGNEYPPRGIKEDSKAELFSWGALTVFFVQFSVGWFLFLLSTTLKLLMDVKRMHSNQGQNQENGDGGFSKCKSHGLATSMEGFIGGTGFHSDLSGQLLKSGSSTRSATV